MANNVMEGHVRVVGILYIIGGALGILIAFGCLVVFGLGALGVAGAAMNEDPDAIVAVPIIGALGTALVAVIVICSIPGIVAGMGLLKYRPWARVLTIILAALNILNVPIGTALGIYSFWVLLNKDTEQLFAGAATATQPPMPT
jgi:hypothetical protein